METNNLKTRSVKKVWETPKLIDIKLSEIKQKYIKADKPK